MTPLAVSPKPLKAYHTLKCAIAHFGEVPARLPETSLTEVKRMAKMAFELEDLILSSAEAATIVVPEESIQSASIEILKRYDSKEDFLQDLEANGLTEASFKVALERELRSDAALELVTSRIPDVTASEIEAFYKSNAKRFDSPETRTVRHILVTINDDYAENVEAEALKRISAIAEKLKTGGDFEALAMENSECPTAMQGGLLGRVPEGKLYPELDAVLFDMGEGAVSKPIKTEVGFHLLRCDEIYPAGPLPLEMVESQIKEALTKAQVKKVQTAWLKTLATKREKG